ncbi:MAG: hypothetical protein P9X24_05285 [Candidatus Hatepunaea meridiana]|nr:hypothetical protein [Candidatus Hatepunaea meridiana]
MINIVKYLCSFIVLAFIIAGCEGENETGLGSYISDPPIIDLRITHSLIRGYDGEVRSERVTALVRNAGGVPVSGAEINFAIQDPEPWKGTITVDEANSVTNENGEIYATYQVELTERSGDVVIVAYVGSVTQTASIKLEIVELIGALCIEAPRGVIIVPPHQTASANVTANVIDKDGNRLPGLLIHFRTDPSSLGFFDSDTGVTDFYGRALRIFHTVVNNYGTCKLYASVGTLEDSTTIDIIPSPEPRYIQLFTETPLIRVVPGENAQIELHTIVADRNGNGLPGVIVNYEILPFIPGGEIFGSIIPFDTTDNAGRNGIFFNTLGGSGKIKIRAEVANIDEEVSAERTLSVIEIYDTITGLRLSIDPAYFRIPVDSVATAIASARVIDHHNIGLANIEVNFSCEYGTITDSSMTDSSGLAKAEYRIQPSSDFPLDVSDLTDTITASIPNTQFISETEIRIVLRE